MPEDRVIEMKLENTPVLTSSERAAIAAYKEAHSVYVASAMNTLLDYESAEELGRAVEQVEEAY